MKCPKCQTDNPDSQQFCGDCGTQLPPSGEVTPSPTKTIETPKEELTTGSTFAGRYQIIEELGRGGMGKVYKTNDIDIKEKVAIKLIKPEISTDKKTIERFQNELKFARKIRHKNVCQMYDLNREEGTYYITMEYVEGENLKNMIRMSGQLGIGTALSIGKQVCEGLAEAHKPGVVHRDLKPSNIMIDREGNVRIMDFGIARSLKEKGITGAGVMIGTPDYMSPEQAEAKGVDQRSDIYSLGVILYEMVTGRVPFEGDTALSIAMKHKGETPKDPRGLNPQIPEDLSRVILKCLEKGKDSRYQSAGDVRSELDQIEKGIPTTEREAPVRKPLTSKEITVSFSVKKLFIPALVIITIIIIGLVIWSPWSKKEITTISSDKPSLAILYFKNNTGDQSLDHWRIMLSNLLISDLTQSRHLRILSEDRMFNILSQMNQLEAIAYSPDVLKQVANQGRVDHILQGAYAKAGDQFRINVMLQEASTGELIGSESVAGKGEESIFLMVDELTRRIKSKLNLTQEQTKTDFDRAVGKITTSSPEALKAFIEGSKLFPRAEFRKSLEYFEKAVSIDPDFAMAYRKMGSAYGNLGNLAKRAEFYKKAFELADRMSDRERYQIQGDYYRQNWRTHDKAVEAYTKLVEHYPDSWTGNLTFGNLYRINDEWDKAIERYETNIQNKEYTGYMAYFQASEVYKYKGMYDKAMEVLDLYLSKNPDHASIFWKRADNYLDQGNYDLAQIEVDKAYSLNPTYHRSIYLKGHIYLCQGDFIKAEERYSKLLEFDSRPDQLLGRLYLTYLNIARGTFIEAERLARMGIAQAKESGEKYRESILCRKLVNLHLNLHQPEKALEEAEEALMSAEESGDFEQLRLAYIAKCMSLIKMGSLREAQKVADELKYVIAEGMNRKAIRDYYYLQGQIELVTGNFPKAIEHFEQAISLLSDNGYYRPMYFEALALAYFKSGDMTKAEDQYQNIISLPTGMIEHSDICVKSYYMLGKIYEQQGDIAKAIEHYHKFLDLWKDADPGIAEVEDARERGAGLKNQK